MQLFISIQFFSLPVIAVISRKILIDASLNFLSLVSDFDDCRNRQRF